MDEDRVLQRKVLDELEWDPKVGPADIGVSVNDGVVTLDGRVHAPFERKVAERAAWTAPGVTQVVDRLTVEPIA